MLERREFLGTLAAVASFSPVKCRSSNAQRGGNGVIRSVEDLEQACRAGGRHIVQPGTYILGDKVLRPVSGTQLIGTAGQTILQKTTSPGSYRLRAFFDVEDASDVTLEGLVLDHHAKRTEHGLIVRSSAPGQASNIRMHRCELRQCHIHLERFVEGVGISDTRFLGAGIALAGIATGGQISKADGRPINANGAVRNIRLERLYFERTLTEAIDINWHTQDLIARQIRAYNCDVGGEDEVIDIGGDVHTTPANACRNIRFEDVVIENDTPGASATVGINVKGQSENVTFRNVRMARRHPGGKTVGFRIWSSDHVSVDGLDIAGWSYGIISTARGQRPPRAAVLRNVRVRNPEMDAIQLEGRDITLDGFDVEAGSPRGVGVELLALEGAVIRNGQVRSPSGVGVRAQASSADVDVEGVTVNGQASGKGFDLRGRQIRLRAR